MSVRYGILGAITSPGMMEEIAERDRLVMVKQTGLTREEAEDALFNFDAATSSEGNVVH